MDKKVKQRFVGAIVLIAFACVLIPVVFHSNSIKSENVAMSPIAAPAPAKPELITKVNSERISMQVQHMAISERQPEADQKQALINFETPAKYKNSQHNKTVETQWFLQLASFRNLIHAKKLITKIEKDHLKENITTTVHLKANHRDETYQVVLGPMQSAEQARKLQQTLLKITKLKGLILTEKA